MLITALLAACTSTSTSSRPVVHRPSGEVVTGGPTGRYVVAAGIHKIKHVIIVMQENRSFDSYFGTYPARDRHPDARWEADGVRAEPGRRVHPALP